MVGEVFVGHGLTSTKRTGCEESVFCFHFTDLLVRYDLSISISIMRLILFNFIFSILLIIIII